MPREFVIPADYRPARSYLGGPAADFTGDGIELPPAPADPGPPVADDPFRPLNEHLDELDARRQAAADQVFQAGARAAGRVAFQDALAKAATPDFSGALEDAREKALPPSRPTASLMTFHPDGRVKFWI